MENHILYENVISIKIIIKETIFLSDVNIDGRVDKHRLIDAVHGMNFKHLVNEVTRTVSGTRLDHIYSNHTQRIMNISTLNCGLSDHVPIFAVRKYSNERASCSIQQESILHAYACIR